MHKGKLFMIILITLLIMGGCSSQLSDVNPKAKAGIIDLTQVEFENDVVQLDGEWEIYWNQLLGYDEVGTGIMAEYIDIPSSWNKYIPNKEIESGDGYATYRLTFITEENGRLALKIPRLRTAYKLWVNGELSALAGQVGKTKETMVPQYLTQTAFFEVKQGRNEIIIQLSNFHQRSGGILESITLGSEEQILRLRYTRMARELFLFGSLISIGTYHLSLFFFRKKNTSPMYFGVFCILIGIRTLVVGESYFTYLFPRFNWEIQYKIQALTFYLGVPSMLMFFLSIFPQYFHTLIIRMAQLIAITFGILVLLTPARIFTVANPLYQIWTIIMIIYILGVLMKIYISKENGSWLIILGALALLLTTLNDIIFLSIWKNDNGSSFLKTVFNTGELTSFGQFIFAITNSLLLAKRFSSALEQEEIMIVELTEINANLDELVLQRTKALEESTEKIQQQKFDLEKANRHLQYLSLNDSLTGVWNRRKYDNAIKIEWNRSLRQGRPIALILIDIDHFKLFNDTYGHMAGDECLIKVAKTLKNSLSRPTDMVARYGGEEFAVLLAGVGKEETVGIANMLREKIEALNIPHIQSPRSRYVTVSIGVACMIPNINSSHKDLFKVADKALYEVKTAGRNQVKFLYS